MNKKISLAAIVSVFILLLCNTVSVSASDTTLKVKGTGDVSAVKDGILVLKKGSRHVLENLTVTGELVENDSISLLENSVVKAKKNGETKLYVYLADAPRQKIMVYVIPKNATVYKDGFYYHKLTNVIKKRITGISYKEDDRLDYSDLRYVRVKYYDFKGEVKLGELIVNKAIAKDITKIFYKLYQKKYPIQRMRLIDDYGGDDERSMRANNTSAFNFRTISGSSKLSNHAFGMAIDINPRLNPYVSSGGKVSPANGKVYVVRSTKKCTGKYSAYMIQKDSYICRLFRRYGFSWGGSWKYSKDYQHFEKISSE